MKNEKLLKHSGLKKKAVIKAEGPITNSDDAAKILGRVPAKSHPARRVPAKWRWHYGVLIALQGRLMRERGDLLRAAAQPLEHHSMDESDSATDEFDRGLALAQLSAERNALYEVNDALKRILDGNYGVCEETGQLIPAARLRAVPWTRFTYAVEQGLEAKGVVPRAGLNQAGSVRAHGQIRLASEVKAEDGEKPSAMANDETLSRVFFSPGRRVPPQKSSKPSPRADKRNERNT